MASQTTPKTMSSRLLTMKFMQRAVASPSSSPSTPTSEEQSFKRRKVSHSSTPPQRVDSLVNQSAIQAAIAEEEKKREGAVLQRATELGDAHWVLQVPEQSVGSSASSQAPLNIVQVGFGQIDSSDATEKDQEPNNTSHDAAPALRRFNMGKNKAQKKARSDSDDDSGTGSDSDMSSAESGPGRQSYGSGPDTPSSASQSSQKKLQHKKSAERTKAMQFAEKRRQRDVKLNNSRSLSSGGGLSSISSGGTSSRPGGTFTCYRCGQSGHKAVDCKSTKRQVR
ncbi:hypothetical protein F5Y15DRAFT_140637 [Xylariaceae sp. FL0016]|nr:hypothetical protein F5Y15DRAFT_140637 [Xylariaceae sp. FL0016]